MSTEEPGHWIRPRQGKVIALLHGIGAKDPQDYWHAFLDVLVKDEQLQDFGLFVWKYPTHIEPGSWKDIASTITKRTIRETAPSIEKLGAVWDTTYRTQFYDYQEVVLVCHSMGGLVVKSWIIDVLASGQSERLDSLRHISFYATPHDGAPITTLARWNKQLKDMQLDSPFIRTIGNRWHEHVVAWKDRVLGPRDYLYNRYISHLVIAGLVDRIVPSENATIKGMPLTTIPGDHSEVIQPINADDTRYKAWRHAIDEVLQAKRQNAPSVLETIQQTEFRSQDSSIASLSTTSTPLSSLYHSCFLCCSHHDQSFADKLYADLQANEVKCWYAPESLKTGDRLRDTIYKAIREHAKLLLVLSRESIESVWVEYEVEFALHEEARSHRQLLFPIFIDNEVMKSEKAWTIAITPTRFMRDFSKWKDQAEYNKNY